MGQSATPVRLHENKKWVKHFDCHVLQHVHCPCKKPFAIATSFGEKTIEMFGFFVLEVAKRLM